MTRTATIARATTETDIEISLDLDGAGTADVETGIGFFDHMLEAFARHGLIDLTVRVQGDLHVDGHHTVEDTGIVLGRAILRALGDKRGVRRFGSLALPMDEALVLAAVDVSGRGQLHWDVAVPPVMIGAFDASLAKEFFIALAANAASRCTCAALRARTRTMSWRRRSRPSRALCGRPSKPILAWATPCRPRKEACDGTAHRRRRLPQGEPEER